MSAATPKYDEAAKPKYEAAVSHNGILSTWGVSDLYKEPQCAFIYECGKN